MGDVPGTGGGDKLRAWRQGSVLPCSLLDEARSRGALIPVLDAGDFACVITQSCDLLHPSFEEEPFFEVLVVRRIVSSERDGNYWHGKNPRRIQFVLAATGGRQLYQAVSRERACLDRRLLLRFQPASWPELSPGVVRDLAHWVTKRYRRAAFPDAFNRRAGPAVARVAAAIKRGGESITGIFIRVDPAEELSDSVDYRVILVATMSLPDRDYAELERRAVDCFGRVTSALARCGGIELVDSKLVRESEFSLADIREFPRWDYDYLSLALDSEGSIALDHP